MENKNMKKYMEKLFGKEAYVILDEMNDVERTKFIKEWSENQQPIVISENEKKEVLEETKKSKKIVNAEMNVFNVSNLYPCVMYASQKELDENLKARINGVLLTNISFDEKLKNVMVLVENYRQDSLKLYGDKLIRDLEHREGK